MSGKRFENDWNKDFGDFNMARETPRMGDKYPGGLDPANFCSPGRFARRFAPGVAAPSGRPPRMRGYPLAVVGPETRIEQKFLCSGCGFLLREPVQNSCGHRYCQVCIFPTNDDDEPAECVACDNEGEESKIEPDQCLPDRAIRRDMAALHASCYNPNCSWSGRFSDYIVHESSCEHRPEVCECGALVEAASMTRHLSKECPLRSVTCAFCNQSLEAINIPGHQDECCMYPMSCPDCHQKVPRVNLEVHVDPVRGDCPKRKCPYGCDAIMDPEHQNTCIAQHLDATFRRLLTLEEQMKQSQNVKMEERSLLSATAKPFHPSISAREQCEEMRFGGPDGILEWPVRSFGKKRLEAMQGETKTIYSRPFIKGRNGYRICACLYLDGDGMTKGRSMGFFFVIVRGQHDAELPWPFPHKVTMILKDQTSSGRDLVDSFKPDPTSSSFKLPVSDRNTPSGFPSFCALGVLDDPDSRYVKDDAILLKVIVG